MRMARGHAPDGARPASWRIEAQDSSASEVDGLLGRAHRRRNAEEEMGAV